MQTVAYNRQAVIDYASKWAKARNPVYYNFDKIGGDCTNFASQCIYAGCGIMNHKPIYGWYYYDIKNRAASWTGVPYLYNFLVGNKGAGPYAEEVDFAQAEPGDIVQFGTNSGKFYHTPVIVDVDQNNIYIAAHSDDAYMRPLQSYTYDRARFLKILAVRTP